MMHGSKFLGVLFGLVSIPVASVMAQASAYGQCGGSDWTGPTTCVSGYTCTLSSPYYSQCLPGTTSTTSISAATYTRPRAGAMCRQWDRAEISKNYILCNNLWGMSEVASGSQCTTLLSIRSTTISWKTTWSWAGGPYNVKSFANANLNFTPRKISAISSIPSIVKFNYTGTRITANVAYDIFTSAISGGAAEYEVMIWLASYGGAIPISSTRLPIASGISLAGQTWNLYKGPHGSMTVFSFVATSNGGVVSKFSGDAKVFLTYLTTKQGLPTSQFVNTVQFGTEPFLGSNAVLTVSGFSIAVK